MGLSDGVRAHLASVDEAGPRYWPISMYGVIGDCRTAALIAPNGSVDWLCLPHFDSPACLPRLLDHDTGGYFQVRPEDACDAFMRYLPATNALETRFTTATGELSVTDFMPIRQRPPHSHVLRALAAISPAAPHGQRAELERQIGNDVAAAHRVNRLVSCESGSVSVRVTLKLTPDYARYVATPLARPAGASRLAFVHHDRTGAYIFLVRSLARQNTGDNALEARRGPDGTVEVTAALTQGARLAVALSYARNVAEAKRLLAALLTQDFDADLHETLRYWTTWSSKMTYQGPYHEMALRSALALKLCVFEPTGAIVAAPTTSLPEAVGGERNWDYRFTWLRDSSLTLQALTRLGYLGEARDYVHFLHDLHLRHGDDIRVLYSIRGEMDGDLREHNLSHLAGYMESRPVRAGNGAATQRQMDIYGELADTALRYANAGGFASLEFGRAGPRDLVRLMTTLAEFVCEHWRDLDRGIWEERGPERPFVYSRVMCWVALDRAITLVQRSISDGSTIERWRATERAIRDEVEQHGYSVRLGNFVQAYGVEAADAANLRIALVGFLPPDDPRIESSVLATGKALAGEGPLLYRYLQDGAARRRGRVPATDDGLRGDEGAFLACAFWYVSALCKIGRASEARTRLEALLEYASPLGLFSEEIDPLTGAMLGNYPQAFTHLALINALCLLREVEDGGVVSVE
jgi:GH15 family glucan-1,4-alpha-glucosidase